MRCKSKLYTRRGCTLALVIGGLLWGNAQPLPGQQANQEAQVPSDTLPAPDEDDGDATNGIREELPPIPEPESPRPQASSTPNMDRESDRERNFDREPGELGVRVAQAAPGVVVRGVIVGSAANNAGVRPGDHIVSLDGEAVRSVDDLVQHVNSMHAGHTCSIEVWRDGQTRTVSAVLQPRAGYYDGYGRETDPVRYRRERYYSPREFRPYYRPRGYSYYYGPRYYGPRYYGPRPYGSRYYRPRYYGRYYGTPNFGYYDYGYRRGGVRLGPLNLYW